MLWLTIKITSGRARTMNSGFTRGNGPISCGTTLLSCMRLSISPIKDDGPATYGPRLTSKYTRAPCTSGGRDCAAACTPFCIRCHTACTCCGGWPSTTPTECITRSTSADVRGSNATVRRPSASRRSPTRAELDSSTTSGLSATMASTFGSSPPPTTGSLRCKSSGQLE